MSDAKAPSDAFAFFGATGDLAYKKIFPALQSLVRRGKLDCPVIGVAKSGWSREQLLERASRPSPRDRRLAGEARRGAVAHAAMPSLVRSALTSGSRPRKVR